MLTGVATHESPQEGFLELAFAKHLKGLLELVGAAAEHYITAELQPFSNQQRPDVVFIPSAGGYAGQVIFLEIKLTSRQIADGQRYANLVEHKTFAEEALEKPISRYFFITRQVVPEFSIRFLAARGIIVFDHITTPEDVVDRLRGQSILQ